MEVRYSIVVKPTVTEGVFRKYGLELEGHGSSLICGVSLNRISEEGLLFALVRTDMVLFWSFWKSFLRPKVSEVDLKPFSLPGSANSFVVYQGITEWPFASGQGPSAEEIVEALHSALGKIRAE